MTTRILVIYHDAGSDFAGRLFDVFGRRPSIRLRVLGPRRGLNPATGRVVRLAAQRGGAYDRVTGRVHGAMRDFKGPYLTGLFRELVRFRPHVMHCFNEAYATNSVQALRYRNLFCRQARCFSSGAQNVINPAPASRAEQARRAFVHRYSDGVACWGTTSARALEAAGFPAPRLHLTHWGIPLDRFYPARDGAVRRRLGLDDSFVVGIVGRVEEQKGMWTLLRAMQRLPPHVKCLCVGDGRWRPALEQRVRSFGMADRWVLVPEVPYDDVAAYMNAADVLVMPSETTSTLVEQFGRVLVEAMACGVPVVGSDSGAIPEVIGNAGLVFPERDFLDLAACISRIAEDEALRRRLVAEGLERSRRLFGTEAYVDRLLAMYGVKAGEAHPT